MREGAHLHAREAGVDVTESESAQAEPLVGTLEVRLDLRGREEGASVDEISPPHGRDEDEPAGGGAHRSSRHACLGRDGLRRNSGVRDVLDRTVLSSVENLHPHLGGIVIGVEPVAGHDLGKHDRGVGVLRRGVHERPLEREMMPRHGGKRDERRTRLVERARLRLDAERGEHRREHVVSRAHGRLLRGLSAAHDSVCRERGERRGATRREQLHLAGGSDAGRARANDEADLTERLNGEGHERLELAAPLRRRIGGEAELLEGACHVEDAAEHADGESVRESVGVALDGERHVSLVIEDDVIHQRGAVMADVGGEQLGGRRPDATAQQLTSRERHLRRRQPRILERVEHVLGREETVATPRGIELLGSLGGNVRDVREKEVREATRRPPVHVAERDEPALLDRLSRRPRGCELSKVGHLDDVLRERSPRLEL